MHTAARWAGAGRAPVMSRERRMRVLHDVKRVMQTPATFTNWPVVLSAMAAERVGRGPQEIAFRTRSGVRIDCPNRPGARVPVYEMFAQDGYCIQWFLGDLADRPIRVVDIGAHIGTFACQLASLHPSATIQCFEPSPTTAEYLRRNVAQNSLADRIAVRECALAPNTGDALFDDNGAGSGLNGLVSAGRKPTGTATRVEAVTFDSVAASSATPIDLVKIDCEGGEYDLMDGSSPGSWSSVSRVVLEYHAVPGRTWSELRVRFAEMGLNLVRHEFSTDRYGAAWLSRDPLPKDPRRRRWIHTPV